MSDKIEHVDWILEQAKSAYNSELELKHKLRDRVSFVSGILITPVLTAEILLISTYKGSYQSIVNIIFFIFPICIVVILSFISIYYIFSVLFKKHTYELQLFPSQILEYYLSGTNCDQAIYDTKYMYLKSLNEAVDINFLANKSRMNKILQAQRAAIFTVPLLLLSFPNYFYFSKITKPEIYSVEIINIKQLKESLMTNQTNNSTPNQPQQQNTTQSQTQSRPLLQEPSKPAPARTVVFDSVPKKKQP